MLREGTSPSESYVLTPASSTQPRSASLSPTSTNSTLSAQTIRSTFPSTSESSSKITGDHSRPVQCFTPLSRLPKPRMQWRVRRLWFTEVWKGELTICLIAGIEYNAIQVPQPIAGPAYPQHQPVALPPNPPPVPPPQPQPQHHQAPHHPPSPIRALQLDSPPRPVAHPASARSPSAPLGDLTHCPTCDLPLTTLSSSRATDHLRQCLDGAGGTVMQCPVCELNLANLTAPDREMHVDACCNGGVGTDKGKERAREYAGEYCRCTEGRRWESSARAVGSALDPERES
jgi:hypothetical protein